MRLNYFVKIFIILNFSQIFSDVGTKLPWDRINLPYGINEASRFNINFYDDQKHLYDYQEGIISRSSDHESNIQLSSPLSEHIWLKDTIIYEYNESLNEVRIMNADDYTLNYVNTFILKSLNDLKKEFTIRYSETKKDNLIELHPIKNHSLLDYIHIEIDKSGKIKKINFFDKLKYNSELVFTDQKIVINMNSGKVSYPKSAEVIKHVRHTVI